MQAKFFTGYEMEEFKQAKTLCVGIDAGKKTGVAVWNKATRRLEVVDTMSVSIAMLYVMELAKEHEVVVYLEDARLRKYYGHSGVERLQGAGSIKRDCVFWEDFCRENKIEMISVAPKNNYTKLTSEQFRRLTGWEGRSSEHSRDAACLVFGR